MTEPLLAVRDLVKEYPPAGSAWRRANGSLRAVDGVSFDIQAGETFGLVGESGSGKTTTGRCVLRLVEPTSGRIRFRGRDLLSLGSRDLRHVRREMQAVFQDPVSSLDPRMRGRQILEEPLVIHRVGTRAERRERVGELAGLVGLDPGLLDRRPAELSGGQRQRLAIARALALDPAFVVADEPVSSLDVSVQAQVVNLLADLRDRLGLTCLFITHDLGLVRHLCSRAAVMCRGRILEIGPVDALFASPAHPYTRALLSAIPRLDPGAGQERIDWTFEASDLRQELREVGDGHWARTRG